MKTSVNKETAIFPKLLAGFALLVFAAHAQDGAVDENALFSDTSNFVDSSRIIDNTLSAGTPESTRVNFSGGITSAVEGSFYRNWFETFNRDTIKPSACMVGNLLLDVRLPADIKAFGNVEATYNADSGKPSFSLQELFLDANIKRRVYFRTGKQVLQWGRCYFWNPTDLINIDRKKFIPELGYQEGTYGIKVHVPFGTKLNIYGFVDMRELKSIDSIAGSAKVEFLIGGTEIGTEIWGRQNRKPVAGLDFSTRLLGWDINGEASLTSGKNYTGPDWKNSDSLYSYLIVRGAPIKDAGSMPVTRVCLGISRMFDLLNIPDRVNVDAEFYYNQAGSSNNFFKDNGIEQQISALPNDTLKGLAFAAISNFMEPNSYSKFYGAFFTSISKFIFDDLTFNFNGIMNFEQRCAMLSVGLQYLTLHNFSLGMLVSGAVGPKETEYTLFDNGMTLRFTAGVAF